MALMSIAGAAAPGPAIAAETAASLREHIGDNWYRTEVLVFVRDPGTSDEYWDPLPAPSYPSALRYFIDPALAEQRLGESQAYASRIDNRGVQILEMPTPIEELLFDDRPDALLEAPSQAAPLTADGRDPNVPLDPNSIGEIVDLLAPEDPNAPLVALPYELLDSNELTFIREARSLRRRGYSVVFHQSWWAPLVSEEETLPVAIDNAGDPDARDWPALQGSIKVYLSRYLHLDVNLWLNTMGEYLPAGWRIPAPPVAPPSVRAATLSGRALNPWAPVPRLNRYGVENGVANGVENSVASGVANRVANGVAAPVANPSGTTTALGEQAPAAVYPWRHAIIHQQQRRMRSSEIHYLDHPVIGVVVRITPLADTSLPLRSGQERVFRERHGLPTQNGF